MADDELLDDVASGDDEVEDADLDESLSDEDDPLMGDADDDDEDDE